MGKTVTGTWNGESPAKILVGNIFHPLLNSDSELKWRLWGSFAAAVQQDIWKITYFPHLTKRAWLLLILSKEGIGGRRNDKEGEPWLISFLFKVDISVILRASKIASWQMNTSPWAFYKKTIDKILTQIQDRAHTSHSGENWLYFIPSLHTYG